MKTVVLWNWTHKKYLIESLTFPPSAPSSSVWLMREICSPIAATHHTKTLFFLFIFWLQTRIFYRETSGRRLEEGKKIETYGFPRVPPPSPLLSSGRHLFFFFFYIRPSARDYGPQWLWITCRGLARSPVTKSFWRISCPLPSLHHCFLFLLFVFCFLLRSVRLKSCDGQGDIVGKKTKVGIFLRHNLWLIPGVWLAVSAAVDLPGGISAAAI